MAHEQIALCSHARCEQIAALIATHALGGQLQPEEDRELLGYLAYCRGCAERMADYASLARMLPLAIPETEPPPALRKHILLAARNSTRRSRFRLSLPRPQLPGWRRWLAPALALLALLALVWGLSMRSQIQQQRLQQAQYRTTLLALLGNDDAREHRLTPTALAPQASGRLLVAPSASALGLYVKNLPPQPPGRVYQLWLITADERSSGGLFRVDDQGRAWLVVRASAPLDQVEAVGITDEPEGGSLQPTGERVLAGGL